MRILGIVVLGAALGGCASNSADIMPAYVSPVAYQTYTCQQLALEAQSISTRAATLSGVQDSSRESRRVEFSITNSPPWGNVLAYRRYRGARHDR